MTADRYSRAVNATSLAPVGTKGRDEDKPTFTGRPCDRCSLTLRYVSTKLCVACRRARGTGLTPADGEKWLALLSSVAPCKKCGSTERYEKNGNCVTCARARTNAWQIENDEKYRAGIIEYQKKNAARIKVKKAADYIKNAEKMKAQGKVRYAKNRARLRALHREWVKANPERVKQSQAKWAKKNPENARKQQHARRARKANAKGTHSPGLVARLLVLQKGKCPCCKKPLGKKFHLDHRIPLARGGTNEDDNMQLLRPRCNMQKNAKDPIDFMQSRGFLL